MDESEKMMLEGMRSDMRDMREDTNNINKNILYLCSHIKCSESKIQNIENCSRINTERLSICENKVTTLRSWAIAIGSVVVLLIPIIGANI